MKKLVLLFVFFLSSFSFAQESYKYAIIPKKFNFFKEENRFNLNSITKSFFENQGFEGILIVMFYLKNYLRIDVWLFM